MNVDPIMGSTGALLKLALDAAHLKQQVHAANIANANVQGYAPLRLSFGDQLARLRDALAAGDAPAGLPDALDAELAPAVDEQGRAAAKVEIDQEVAEIAHNTLHYQALLRGMSKHLSLMALAIADGRK